MMDHGTVPEQLQPRIISSLQDMIRIRSVEGEPETGKPFGECVNQALEMALATASSLGFRTVNHDGIIGYAEYGAGKEMIAVLGHLDVVPEGTGWTYPPFGAEIHGGRIYGRGTTDDKGPTMAALWALKILADEGHTLSKRIRIIFGTNEESGFRGINWYAENEEHPVAGFTPDINEGIVHAEKGGIHVELAHDISPESSLRLVSFVSGQAVNIVPDLAEAVFCGDEKTLNIWSAALKDSLSLLPCGGELQQNGRELTIKVFGKSAHASLPEKGENAISALCVLLAKTPPPVNFTEAFANLAALIEDPRLGTGLGIDVSDEVSGPLTCNPGLASFTGDVLNITLDIRYPVTVSAETIIGNLDRRVSGSQVRATAKSRALPLHVPKDSPIIMDLSDAYCESTGKKPKILAIGGGTYAKALPNVVAFAPFPVALPELAHQADEYIEIDDLMSSVIIMKNAILRLAR